MNEESSNKEIIFIFVNILNWKMIIAAFKEKKKKLMHFFYFISFIKEAKKIYPKRIKILTIDLETKRHLFSQKFFFFVFSIKDGPSFVVIELFHFFSDFSPESPQEVVDERTVDERKLQGFFSHHYLGLSNDSFDGRDGAASDLDLEFGSVFEQSGRHFRDQFRAVGHHAKVLKFKQK